MTAACRSKSNTLSWPAPAWMLYDITRSVTGGGGPAAHALPPVPTTPTSTPTRLSVPANTDKKFNKLVKECRIRLPRLSIPTIRVPASGSAVAETMTERVKHLVGPARHRDRHGQLP